MAIKFLSGFRGIDNAKQGLRRSTQLGSAATGGGTILATSQNFDPQACFVYLNGSLLREGTSGNGGDYVLSGNSTVTFNSAVASTDVIEVVSYNFANPTLPETMIEVDHTVTSANATYHATSVTGASYTASSDTLVKTSHGLAVDDVINVTVSPTSGSLAVGRYRVQTVTDANNVVLRTVNDQALTYGTDSASANIEYEKVFSKRVNNLTLQNKAMVFLNGMLLVENTDFYRDQQAITIDSTVNLLQNHVLAIRHFGSFTFPTSSEIGNAGIEIIHDTSGILLTSTDVGSANVTSAFKLIVSARHSTATNDSYRVTEVVIRGEKNAAAQCYAHKVWDVGNIGADMEIIETNNYSDYTSVTDGKLGIAVHADSNYWYVYLVNRSGHSIVAGFEASAISN